MARIQPHQGLLPSVLDRLIDPESRGTESRPGYGFQQILEVVRRDLEDLLNTRQTAKGPLGLSKSIYAFGLPDLTAYDIKTGEQKSALGKILEQTIRTFEPRLRDIRAAVVVPEKGEEQRAVSFRIEATLSVEPYDDVIFQTQLELSTGRYSVQ